MEEQPVRIFDFTRIMNGDVPSQFLLEVVLRIFVVFLIILFSMRFLGRRMSSTLNRNDLAALVSMAAAVGIPILEPTRGLLPAVIISFVIVVMIKGVNRLLTYRRNVEKISQGTFDILIKDGVIQYRNLHRNGISKQQLFGQMRAQQIVNLGQVQRLYIEPNGNYIVKRALEEQPGLSTIPPWDKDFFDQERIGGKDNVCGNCGMLNENRQNEVCPECFHCEWKTAVHT